MPKLISLLIGLLICFTACEKDPLSPVIRTFHGTLYNNDIRYGFPPPDTSRYDTTKSTLRVSKLSNEELLIQVDGISTEYKVYPNETLSNQDSLVLDYKPSNAYNYVYSSYELVYYYNNETIRFIGRRYSGQLGQYSEHKVIFLSD
jgi:hypothetical protein